MRSRLDYSNSWLLGCSEKYKTSLRHVPNCLAGVETQSCRLPESGPCSNHCIGCLLNRISNLNWTFWHLNHYSWLLPHISVSYCITWLRESPALRSESMQLSTCSYYLGPQSKRNYGHSSFVVAAPRLWNKLPLEICEAKSVTIFREKN